MLSEAVVQVLRDTSLFPRADLQNRFLQTFSLGNVKSYAVNEPRPTIFAANHFCFALKPEHPAIARHDAVRRAQRFAREEHLCGFLAPAHLVVGMNLLIP